MKSFILLLMVVILSLSLFAQDNLGKKYTVKIIDDHAVQLVNAGDTITLSLENASNLAEESVIFVNSHNTKSKSVDTGKKYTDSKGVQYPVMKGVTGKYYYVKTSAKTGNPYKVYIQIL